MELEEIAEPDEPEPPKKLTMFEKMMKARAETKGMTDGKGNQIAPGGNLKPRPPGRAPAGKEWNAKIGDWVDDPAKAAAAEQPVLIPKPAHRPPNGKEWDGVRGKWVTPGESSDSDSE